MSADDLTPVPLSRRQLLATGGLTVSLAAVVAACGGGEEAAPGRVGNAPVVTDLPTVTVDDVVLLRTATSLERTALDVYAQLQELGALGDDAGPLVERLIEDHTRNAGGMADQTEDLGGEAYECANPWFAARVLPPLYERIAGNEDVPEGDEPIEPSDDPVRDGLTIAYALETTLGAMYQQLIELLSQPEVRATVIAVGAESVRHAGALAIARDGAPAGYVSPVLFGEDVDPTQTDGVLPIFAVTGNFGSLAPVSFTLGPASDAGTRFTTSMQTPADNSFVYADLTCDA